MVFGGSGSGSGVVVALIRESLKLNFTEAKRYLVRDIISKSLRRV